MTLDVSDGPELLEAQSSAALNRNIFVVCHPNPLYKPCLKFQGHLLIPHFWHQIPSLLAAIACK
jgi:hypothetical protein